jgi:anti-sigma regulatory factor (Ser/Thr protein kinase)
VHQSHLVLGALPSAVPCARLHASLVLAEWDLKALAETTEMVVSEIVTNAVRASAGLPERHHGLPAVQLWLSADHEHVLIEVWDADERMPVRQQPDPEAEHGRGLLLVEALSEDYGAYRPAGYPGKIVWARCGVTDAELS